MKRYFAVWLRETRNSFETFFSSRFGAILFLTGKILRFFFYLGFLLLLVTRTKVVAGYSIWEIFLFYLTFNFIDSATQMLFREVYQFRQKIVRGDFDLVLVKPVNALFRSLFGATDLLDFITLIPFTLFIIYVATRIPNITFWGAITYLMLVINAFTIAVSFHIIVLALAVLTTEVDHAIMIYRDIIGMGKIPVDIYDEPLRSFVTFVIPVGVMMTFPVKAFIGRLGIEGILSALSVSGIFLIISLSLWRYALRQYTSVSG